MKKIFLSLLFVFCSFLMFAEEGGDWIAKKIPAKLIKNNKKQVDAASVLNGKMVLLYFSASWCGPCRNFTPELVKFYKSTCKKENIEVVLVTSDKTENAMMKYFKKMPWYALAFNDPAIKNLKTEFKVTGIPKLVVLDSKGKMISANGRNEVVRLGEKAAEAWKSGNIKADDNKKADDKDSEKKSKKSKKSKKDKKSKKSKSSKKK